VNLYEIVKQRQLFAQIYYDLNQRTFIAGMPQLLGNEWSGNHLPRPPWPYGDAKKVKALTKFISESLEELQGNECIYCGMPFGVTSGKQVEHIAPKGEGRYPEFTFEALNLVLSCSLCNGFEKKERAAYWDTVETHDPIYANCTFKIVHPYFDDPQAHINLDYTNRKVLISAITPKGQRTIDTFILDSEALTTERGKIARLHELELREAAEELAQQVLNYTGMI
jgi:uncharacterized protein (TIGR02646 family)